MLTFLTVAVMLIVAYSFWREGLLTAITMLVSVLVAGVVTFNFFEPVANELESMFQDTFLAGFEDSLALFLLFALTLGGLRVVSNNLAPAELEMHPLFQQIGTLVVALVTGYLVAGFLVVMLQTIPWNEKFLGFDATIDPGEPPTRKVIPPDRIWLSMMHRLGAGPLSWGDDTFDADGSFEIRYARHRRYKEQQ